MGISRNELKVIDIIKSEFKDKSIKILELGPGKGMLVKGLLEAGFTNVEAMDMHPENFTIKNVKCHRGNLSEKLPFDDETYDLVVAAEAIEHLENQYNFASECARITKLYGNVMITTPNITNFASRIRFLFTGFYSLAIRPSSEFQKNWVIEHIYPITFWQLRHILHTNGLFIKILSTSKLRRSSFLGLLFWPLSYLFTYKALNSEKEARQNKVNMEILKQMHTLALYLGRNQIVLTQKEPNHYIRTIENP
ncbi:MAG: class I SAM-dependent methyltransferase [Gammaproteobacteria bacterium]|jgi:SAM-dependent methyltransferase